MPFDLKDLGVTRDYLERSKRPHTFVGETSISSAIRLSAKRPHPYSSVRLSVCL